MDVNPAYFWNWLACILGALANVFIIAGYIMFLSRRFSSIRSTATLAFFISLIVPFPLALHGSLTAIDLGHGLWVASMLSLALGSWYIRETEDRDEVAVEAIIVS